jgi:hypothetical protein
LPRHEENNGTKVRQVSEQPSFIFFFGVHSNLASSSRVVLAPSPIPSAELGMISSK